MPGRHLEEATARQGLAGVFTAPPIVIARAHKTTLRLRVFVEMGKAVMHKETREHRQVRRSHHGRLLVHIKISRRCSPPFVFRAMKPMKTNSFSSKPFQAMLCISVIYNTKDYAICQVFWRYIFRAALKMWRVGGELLTAYGERKRAKETRLHLKSHMHLGGLYWT